ncbi:hypothetical protein FIBSPDRAFT_862697, partial [Athelia psychrophila]
MACAISPPQRISSIHWQAAEASVDVSVAYNILSEGEMCEVEREAESRLSLFTCDVPDGQRGYKKMAGLLAPARPRTIGLMLLGQRGCLQDTRKTTHSLRHSTPSPGCHFRI